MQSHYFNFFFYYSEHEQHSIQFFKDFNEISGKASSLLSIELLDLKLAGPFNNNQAAENPEWDPPIITILLYFFSFIYFIVFKNISFLKN